MIVRRQKSALEGCYEGMEAEPLPIKNFVFFGQK